MDFEDYSAFGDLSDDELMQLAIERSLAEDIHAGLAEDILPNSDTPSPPDIQKPPSPIPATPSPTLRYDDFAEMHTMILNGDEDALLEFITENEGSEVATNTDGWTPLHEAAYFGQLGCLQVLKQRFPDMLNRCSPRNQTALLLAAYRGHVSCVEYLLEQGANANISNVDRESPLFKACANKSERMVELLLSSGASVNEVTNQGATAFHEAAENNHLESCELLFQAGAKISTINIYGVQPFFTAAQSGCDSVVSFLLDKGVNVNMQVRDGATPLYEACKNGHISVVETLLSHNANVNLPTKSGLLPIHIATQQENKQIVSLLLPLTSKTRVRCSGISPLHLAAERDSDDILELLIQAGYDVNSQLSKEHCQMHEDRRSTALYFSVNNNNLEAVEMLLEAGADPNLDFFNPLLIAARKGNVDIAELLLKYGADPNAGMSTHHLGFPSALLLGMDSLPLLKRLLDHGCHAYACFECDYGSKTHPIFSPLWHRQELRYRTESPPQHCINFCEAISNYSSSRPGPVISLLLDYVGNIKLCSRLLEILDGCSNGAHIKSKAVPPHPLMQLCRLRIREFLGAGRMNQLNALPLPNRLKRFLWYNVECISE